MRRYHRFEGIRQTERVRRAALRPLLSGRTAGIIWLIRADRATAGYLAVCFCHSIEFGGRDCFIDEFFIAEELRGRGIGSRALELALARLARLGVRAVSLEVARRRRGVAGFYAAHGFEPRDCYRLLTRRFDRG